jgi:predicted nuclease with TOPRIM domain
MTNEVYIVTNNVVTSLDVLKQINDTYSREFTRLLTVMGLLVGFGAVVLPLIFQFREAKIRKSEMKSEFNEFLMETKAELAKKFEEEKNSQKEEMQEMITELQSEMAKKHAGSTSFQYNIQSILAFDNGDFWQSAQDALIATIWECKSDKRSDLIRRLDFFTGPICEKLNKEDLEYRNLSQKFDQAHEALVKINGDGFLNEKLHELNEAKKQIMNRHQAE